MMELTRGGLAISKAGHDKGRIYVIIDRDDDHVYLVDGELKTVDKPKKKKIKHIQPVDRHVDLEQAVTNEHIKRVLKEYAGGTKYVKD